MKGRDRARILTHVHRDTLYLVADRIPDGTADVVRVATTARAELHGSILTYDRGSEFALWRCTERETEAHAYCAEPHHPWQRGRNENTNGRLRRVFPKRFPLSTIAARDVGDVADLMNHTPRKSLSWRTPYEAYGKACCDSG